MRGHTRENRPGMGNAAMSSDPAFSSSPLLRPRDAAQFLAISESSLRRLVQAGELPVVWLGSGPRSARAFRIADLDAFIESRTVVVGAES